METTTKPTKKTTNKHPFSIRFGAKRLRKYWETQLNDEKRAVIANSCFGEMASISKFSVPDDLLEWVVMNIDPKLCEYRCKHKKPIVFTRDMIGKVFNLPSGDRPVQKLRSGEHTELRNMYRVGDRPRIANLEQLLHDCPNDDTVMITRSWALLSFATVLLLGTNNMVPLDYLGSLLDMDRAHEYAWDEAILAYCMDQVAEFQDKRNKQKDLLKNNPDAPIKQFAIGSCLPALAVIYIDHLEFPVEQVIDHVIDYSLPRAHHVCNEDFELAISIDKNRKTLDHASFGTRPIRDLSDTPYAIVQVHPAPEAAHVAQVHPAPEAAHVAQVHPAPEAPHIAQVHPAPEAPHVAQVHPAAQVPQPSHTFAPVDASVNGSETYVEPSATLADWLQNSMPPMQDLGVPAEFSAFYEKHKVLFQCEVQGALSSFGQVLQAMHCNRMALLLKDASSSVKNADSVQEGTNESNGINFDVPDLDPGAGLGAGGVSMGSLGKSPAIAEVSGGTSPAHAECSGGSSPPNADFSGGLDEFIWTGAADTSVPPATIDRIIDDIVPPGPPSPSPIAHDAPVGLTNKGAALHDIPLSPTNSVHSLPSPAFQGDVPSYPSPARSAGPIAGEVKHVDDNIVDVSSGPSTLAKKQRHKRVAIDFDSAPPKMKKLKVDSDVDALYTKYVLHKQKIKKTAKGEEFPPCIKSASFFTSYENFHSSLRPRGDLDNEVMSLYIENFNMSCKNSRKCKKYAFSCLMTQILAVNPIRFHPSVNCLREWNRACDDFKAHKSDLLYFTVVKDHHWVLVTINMVHKQINIFDSMKHKKPSPDMARMVDNIIVNFATLVKTTNVIKHDIASFTRFTPEEYPQQKTNYDCGYFVILYIINWNGKVMTLFGQDHVPALRKVIAGNLFMAPFNEMDAAAAIAEQAL